MSRENGRRAVAVWDLPTRLFHWLAVVLILAAYGTARLNWMDWHAWAGYALLVILLFRLMWGVWGGETARFSSFLASPGAARRHLAHLFARERDNHVGHNPAGGWMVVALLALMLGQTLSGLYVANDIADEGPLTEIVSARAANLIEAAHDRFLWDTLLAAIALHLAAILFYAAVKRQNLARPMVTGIKLLPIDARTPRLRGAAPAILLLACGVAVAAAIVRFL
jgi:cytochrome b